MKHSLKLTLSALALTTCMGSAGGAALVSDHTVASHAALSGASIKDGRIAAVINNQGDATIAAVKVLVRYDWLWKDELNPGPNSPGWSEIVTIRETIAPGAAAPFVYIPGAPLPARDDGWFAPSAEIVGVTLFEAS